MRDNIGRTIKTLSAILLAISIVATVVLFFTLKQFDIGIKLLICGLSFFWSLLLSAIVYGFGDIINILNYIWLKMNNGDVSANEPYYPKYDGYYDDNYDEEEFKEKERRKMNMMSNNINI